MKSLVRNGLLAMAGALLVLLASGCGPTYPECHSDENCSEKGEYCLNAQCAQCRDDGQCADESQICNAGSCNKIPGYCNPPAFACPGNQKCRDKEGNFAAPGRCGVECRNESECSANQVCTNNACVDKPECVVDADCASGQVCENGNCKTPAQCQPRAVYFDFDESKVRSSEKSSLSDNAACFSERGAAKARLTGHCDERGTEEYNMVLGERRAKAAGKVLRSNGVSKSAIKTKSRGEYDLVVPNARSESEHQKNRRVEFNILEQGK